MIFQIISDIHYQLDLMVTFTWHLLRKTVQKRTGQRKIFFEVSLGSGFSLPMVILSLNI